MQVASLMEAAPLRANTDRGLKYILYDLTKRFLSLPSRVVSRIRHLDAILDPSYSQGKSSGGREGAAVVTMPGPWGFLTSGYFLGLFLMAFVLNRIQNIVVPPRPPSQHPRHGAAEGRRSLGQAILRSFLPIDLSSTYSRLMFRIPSIFLLLKSLALWSFILIQTSGSSLPQWEWVQSVSNWATFKSMDEICWTTFVSVCFALFVGALTSGMEGLNSNSNAPFNLFGYSFILYIYTSPLTHHHKFQGTPSRPDVHVIITIMIPLLQLVMTHCLEVKQRWARQRLIPTTICGMISLVHFHTVMWIFPASYPLPNYVPNLVESFLAAVTLITCFLNAFTQLLLNGAITKPLFGHTATLMPKWDEDFSVALFRLGTASLEATSVAGLGNEVGSIALSSGDILALPSGNQDGIVQISPSGMVIVSQPAEVSDKLRRRGGLTNEIKRVKSTTRQTEMWAETLVNVAWHRELARFGVGLWKVVFRIIRFALAKVRRQPVSENAPISESVAIGENTASGQIQDITIYDGMTDHYERFLRGEDLSEDDEDFDPSHEGSQPGTPLSQSEDEMEDDDDGEAIELYTDLSQSASGSTSAPLLLAHMTNTSASPLTRRRYSQLVSGAPSAAPEDSWVTFVTERRGAKEGRQEDEAAAESRQNCVICTVEPRDIICWPCRCLALCDDCRENLASRLSTSKHLCPCCRRHVEGYSKIYIP